MPVVRCRHTEHMIFYDKIVASQAMLLPVLVSQYQYISTYNGITLYFSHLFVHIRSILLSLSAQIHACGNNHFTFPII